MYRQNYCLRLFNSLLQAGHLHFAQPSVLQHSVLKAGIDFLSTTFGRLQHFLHAAAVSQKLMEDITVRYMYCISVKLTLCIEQCLALHSQVDCHLQQWSVWSILLSESGWWNIRLAQTWSLVWNPITQAHHKRTLVIDILTRHSSEDMWKLTKWNFEKKEAPLPQTNFLTHYSDYQCYCWRLGFYNFYRVAEPNHLLLWGKTGATRLYHTLLNVDLQKYFQFHRISSKFVTNMSVEYHRNLNMLLCCPVKNLAHCGKLAIWKH